MESIIKHKIQTMENMFDVEQKIVPEVVATLGEGEVFKTENGEVVYFEMLLRDFTVDELVRVTHIAEDLWNEHHVHCTCCIIGMGDVCVNEMPIKSEADFTIRLAKSDVAPCDAVLGVIKSKMKRELLDEEDIQALQMIPVMCNPEEKDYYRKEVFAIMNELGL